MCAPQSKRRNSSKYFCALEGIKVKGMGQRRDGLQELANFHQRSSAK